MTLEDLQQMSDAELNELAAVKVMGYKVINEGTYSRFKKKPFDSYYITWNPTSDMNDAMELKKQIRELNFDDPVRRKFYVYLYELVNSQERDWFLYIEPRHITIASILAKEE